VKLYDEEKEINWRIVLEKFLRIDLYDMVQDTQPYIKSLEAEYGAFEGDILNKYFIYSASTLINSVSREEVVEEKIVTNTDAFIASAKEYIIDDPDEYSLLLQKLYNTLWGDVCSSYYMCKNAKISSDTMTSAQTLLNKAMKILDCEMEEIFNKVYKNNKKFCSRLSSVVLFSNDERAGFRSILEEKYPNMIEFMNHYHTIGNYCPVPIYFNYARSGDVPKAGPDSYIGVVYDFWDLTLMKIREYFVETSTHRQDQILIELLHGKGNSLYCKRWLDAFGTGLVGWKNFINILLFQDYVDKDYCVKPFWKDHNWNNIKMVNTVYEIDATCKEINERIKTRECRIKAKLREILDFGEIAI